MASAGSTLGPDERDAIVAGYLTRLGVDAEPPSAPALDRLHRAHVERVAWETIWIHCGEAWSLDPVTSARRIAERGRAGYCYHHNGAFAWLLEALGYRVERHAGAVHGPDGPADDDFGNHLALTVHDLISDEHPAGRWYVDVGTGDALHHPLPLRRGATHRSTMRSELQSTDRERCEWMLQHDRRGAFAAMTWESAVVDLSRFDDHHVRLSSDPESSFVRWLVAFRRDRDCVHRLQGLSYARIDDESHRRTIESHDELFDLLADVFGIGDVPAELRSPIWSRAAEQHAAFTSSSGA
jgi:arylamine N-acetyltransferase